MRIEKVSKIISVPCGGHALYNSIATRKVIMSLPRVRFLEDDEELSPPPVTIEEEIKQVTPLYAMKPVSPREGEALKLKEQGKSLNEIARIMRISVTCAGAYIATARRKLQFQGETFNG
jgi:DNA-binding CsgD family transcriptional regulator